MRFRLPGMLFYVEQYFGARGGGATLHLGAVPPSQALQSFLEKAGPVPS